jgi:hypothetical protein
MLIGSLDGKIAMGLMTGRNYALMGSELIPLFGFCAVVQQRSRFLENGDIELATIEQSYRTDLATGVPLKEWKNPLTGEVVPASHVRFEPYRRRIVAAIGVPGVDLRHELDPLPGRQHNHDIFPVETYGDEVVFQEQAVVKFGTSVYHESMSIRGSATALASSRSSRTPSAQTTYSAVNEGFGAWMKMGERRGLSIGQGYGAFGITLDDVPRPWVEETRRVRPELIDNPMKMLEPLWKA